MTCSLVPPSWSGRWPRLCGQNKRGSPVTHDEINLSGQPLTVRLDLLPEAATARRLILDRTGLEHVPDEIALLGGLGELHLDGNQLDAVSPSVLSLSHLRRLSLYGNRL